MDIALTRQSSEKERFLYLNIYRTTNVFEHNYTINVATEESLQYVSSNNIN